ncbi:high affinity choline transporter 1-like [Pelobates cultripes]|uniref:High affinity choline transporter 1 n=1 Tax=Pelobates cultripes TaxID=61616 RepID=A0AAD1VPC9_PELCU|nr:high affinity choline transporter 1-like [Pelobates cultripes]CAH2225492.1 high affinity choline transporter 1-like [Pelobates cultripes]CAH2225493.1 high affinity choline transporter 1-like [Pelobates cultripes]
MALNVPGLIAVIVFYTLTLATGLWAAWKAKKNEQKNRQTEIAIVGGRNLNVFVGLFTTTATWVGGAYINGTAEIVYLPSRGLAWVHAPLGFAITFIIGGLFFVKPMRSKKYVTMMDPLQEKFGQTMGSILFIPPLLGDVFWFASILASLNATVRVILDVNGYLSIIISACTVILYTLLGGLYSVAYTDVIQLIFIVFSLWICVPFALLNSASENIAYTAVRDLYQGPWLGEIQPSHIARWLDDLAYLGIGGVAWQIYFQRILAASSSRQAILTSYASGFLSAVMGVPSILIGAVAASTDWNQTSYGLPTPNERGESNMILPLVLQYLCPTFVSVAGLGAIAAAVMSSADSSLLSSSSMFAYNIYKKLLRKKASDREVICVMRLTMVLLGTAGMGLAFLSSSIYDLWFLSGELVYALLFPQLCCALFISSTNTYGSAAGFIVGLVLRLLGGEQSLKIPPLLHYPGCTLIDGVYVQLFPFKTFTMLVSLTTIVIVSYLAQVMFMKKVLPVHWDISKVFRKEILHHSQHELQEQEALQQN